MLAMAGCSGAAENASDTASSAADSVSSAASEATSKTVTIEDNYGTHEVSTSPQAVVTTDNRSFEILESWGIKLVAAPKPLIPVTIEGYKNDENIVDIGNHREPNLEALAAANPDLIINGQRFTSFYQDIKTLNPDATILEFEPRDGEKLDAELKRHTLALGEIFGKQDEAQKLVDNFDAALKRAQDAYDSEKTVMGVNVSGGEIGYVAPGKGRFFGPIFDLVRLTPALEIENASDDHQGDDISVEAIAEANPDWLLVLDRDAAVSKDAAPAKTVLEENAALKNVTALKDSKVVYAPSDTYTNENIITYTEVLNSMADAFENAK
ncbi:ABC transporter substrate-binding protein [Rothia sp. ZJ932]|nr:ABC transporter substrate-binding protein [Rothia sp. ZJ1223]MBM7050658.1 ABC transporter substrate-binding protein [Rothia sp. ZJ1223]QRZ62601.1 ABC transporter substrate-binding protein [Rothia sp. ZJ932]